MYRESSPHAPRKLTLKLLGSLQILLAGKSIPALSATKTRALLSYLALTRQTHSRKNLAALLWPDMEEGRAKTNLRQALVKLRQALPNHLLITRQEVGLNFAVPIDVDALYFEDAVADGLAGDRLRLEEAVELYTGDFLAGFFIDNADHFDEWMIPIRERLRGLALQALELLIEQMTQLGQTTDALRYTRQLLDLEPWREESHRQLMRQLVDKERRSEALAQFKKCERILLEELGVAPSAETVALYEQIRSADSVADSGLVERAKLAMPRMQDWGSAPELSQFYGRETEVAQLTQWIGSGTRLVTVLAMGGTGKTTLAAKVATTAAHGFDFVFWRSLLNAPPLDDWLRWAIHFLTRQQLGQLPTSLDERLTLLFELLGQHRCLLILDNVETILQPDTVRTYRPGYEPYDQLIHRMAQSPHRSSLLLTSRECPRGIRRLEEENPLVRTLLLDGLPATPGLALLTARGVTGAATAVTTLVDRYSGNPLALKLIADTIQEIFGGNINAFLADETLVFDDIRTVLDQQFNRLSQSEQDILFWLAIAREPMSMQEIRSELNHELPPRERIEALRNLQRRSLIDRNEFGFALQNVVTEYLTSHLISETVNEFVQGDFNILHRFPLMKTYSKAYVRQSQKRLILEPIGQQLQERYGRANLLENLNKLLDKLREDEPQEISYAAGNLLNLVFTLGLDTSGMDFSYLPVWQVYAQNEALTNTNFTQADLTNSLFTGTFNTLSAVVFDPSGEILAAATSAGEIRFWSASTGQPLGTVSGHTRYISALAYDPLGRYLLSAGEEGIIHLCDLQGLAGLSKQSARTSFTDRVTASTARQQLELQDPPVPLSGIILHQSDYVAHAVAFAPDGSLMASAASDSKIRVWRVADLKLIAVLQKCGGIISALSFGPNGRLVVGCSSDGTIRIWDLTNLCQMTRNADKISHAPTLDECTDVSTTENMSILWQRPGTPDGWYTVEFDSDGSWLASGDVQGLIHLWDMYNYPHVVDGYQEPHQTITAHAGKITNIAFSPDGHTLVTAGIDRLVRLWDVQTGQIWQTIQGHASKVTDVAFHPDGDLLATVSNDSTLRTWQPNSGEMILHISGHSRPFQSVVFSPDGNMIATASDDRLVRIWDVEQINETVTVTEHHTMMGHEDVIWSVAFSPDSRTVASASADRSVLLWDAQSGQPARMLRGHEHLVTCVAFGPQGINVATGSMDESIRIWGVESGRCVAVLRDKKRGR